MSTERVSFSTMAVADLLDALAAAEPAPGGGSASALGGAVGASLLLMVAGMSKTRTGAAEETADLAEAAARLRPLRDRLLALVDRDSEAYLAVVAAFRQPKASAEEKAARTAAVQAATRQATEVPLDTMRACRDAIRHALVVARSGNPNAASDVGVALELLLAGVRGAGLNVDINLGGIADEAFAKDARWQREDFERTATEDAARARDLL